MGYRRRSHHSDGVLDEVIGQAREGLATAREAALLAGVGIAILTFPESYVVNKGLALCGTFPHRPSV